AGPERATGDAETPEARPDAARKPDDAGSLFDRPRGGGPSGLASFPTPPAGPSQDLPRPAPQRVPARDPSATGAPGELSGTDARASKPAAVAEPDRSEEHTSELQSRENLVCRLLLEKNKKLNTK